MVLFFRNLEYKKNFLNVYYINLVCKRVKKNIYIYGLKYVINVNKYI